MIFLLNLALAAEPAPPVTFADLVAQVGEHPSSTTGCLLQPGPAGVAMVGRFQAGEATLTPPPADWDALLARGTGAALVTPRGRTGPSTADIALASLVPVPRAMGYGVYHVLILTDEGLWHIVSAPAELYAAPAARRLTPESLAALLSEPGRGLAADGPVIVTAEAGVPLTRLVTDLAFLADQPGFVVLATAATRTTQWLDGPKMPALMLDPEYASRDLPGLDACPEGLPKKDKEPGWQRPTALQDLVAQISVKAKACQTRLLDDQGGQVLVSYRLNAAGVVERACVQRATVRDPALQRCVLDAVRSSRTEELVRGEYIDLSFQAPLTPPSVPQRLACPAPTPASPSPP